MGVPRDPTPSPQAVSTCAGQKRLCVCDVETWMRPARFIIGKHAAAAVLPLLSGSGRETETDDWLPFYEPGGFCSCVASDQL